MSDKKPRDLEAIALFQEFDRNKDGRLSYEDLRQGFVKSRIDISPDVLTDLLIRFDKDNDGALDFSEMLSVLAVLNEQNQAESQISEMFILMDSNGNKRISRSELKRAMELYCDKKLSSSELDNIMKEVDADKDGYISFQEFYKCIHLFKQ